jgi:hypothetical protein
MPKNPLSGLLGKVSAAASNLSPPPALHAAAAAGDVSRVRLLTQTARCDLDEQETRYQRTALHIAAGVCVRAGSGEAGRMGRTGAPICKVAHAPLARYPSHPRKML